jgi:MFS family permease
MLLSFSLMGGAIVGLALTPAYRDIGVAAPVLAILFRLVQGFAVGGEVGPSTAFLVEAAPPERRGLYVSFQLMSQQGAILAAGLVGVGLSAFLSPDALRDVGWRVAFLLGALILPIGFALRRSLPETLHAAAGPAEGPVSGAYLRTAVLGIFAVAGATIVTYVLTYLPTYAAVTLHMPIKSSFLATTVMGLSGAVFMPIGGRLSDRYGRRPLMMGFMAVLLVLTLPCFMAMARNRDLATLLGADALLSAVSSLAFGAMLTAVTEGLPKALRSRGLALVYATAVAVFGGSAQFIVAWLTHATGNVLAPAWYMAAACIVGLSAMAALKETAPAKLS